MDLTSKLAVIDKATNYLKELDAQIAKLQKERNIFKMGIDTLWQVLDVCPRCRGEKEYFQRSCAEDEGEVRTCRRCNGSGRFK